MASSNTVIDELAVLSLFHDGALELLNPRLHVLELHELGFDLLLLKLGLLFLLFDLLLGAPSLRR